MDTFSFRSSDRRPKKKEGERSMGSEEGFVVEVMREGRPLFLVGFRSRVSRPAGRPARVVEEAVLTADRGRARRFDNEQRAGYVALRLGSAVAVPAVPLP